MTNPRERTSDGEAGDTAGSLKKAVGQQLEGAEAAFDETTSDLSDKASELAGDAKEAVTRKAEETKHGLSGGLKALGGALRAAGDHLSENGQAGSSKLVGEAASGLENFAASLDSKPLGEVFDELRTFGRNNAGGLFAGSLLAGLALGRLLKTAGAEKSTEGQPSADTPSDVAQAAQEDDPQRSTAPEVTATSGYAL